MAAGGQWSETSQFSNDKKCVVYGVTRPSRAKQAMNGDSHTTYFTYLSRSGYMPSTIKTLIDRYHITLYDEVGDVSEFGPVPVPLTANEKPSAISQFNYSANNNDDDVDPVHTPPPQMPVSGTEKSPSPKVLKLKLPSLTRRLSKFGKRSSTDKNKSAVESTSPSGSRLADAETISSATTSMTTVDDPHPPPPETCTAFNNGQKSKDHDEQKDKYEEESAVGICKSSTEDVPLRAKPPINFQDAVFYYPADQTADDDDARRGPAHVLSEGRVPAATATVCCSSDDQLPLKEAISMQPGVGDDMPLIAGSAASRRRPSMLRRMRAFFARSSSSSTGTGHHDEMSRPGRQFSAADASMMTQVVWTEPEEASSLPAQVGGVWVEDPGAARPARSYTSPLAYCGSEAERGMTSGIKTSTPLGTENLAGSLMAEAAIGEQPCDIKNTDEPLMDYEQVM